ncbi:MAG: L,D-transpeptidase family protein [Ilumatobacteraceae bacterium]
MPPRPARRTPSLAPALASCALVGAVLVAGAASGSLGGDYDEDAAPPPSAPAAATTTTVPATTTTALVTTTTTAPIVKTNLSETIGEGSNGDEVEAVQERLKALGFDPGPIDGDFGTLTQAAVWAFEKLAMQTPRAEATGRVTDEMWQFMQEPLQFLPRRPDAASVNHTEVYLPEQVVIFFREDQPALITHMSSGTGLKWCEEVTIGPGEQGNEAGLVPLKRGDCGESKTPGGVFAFDRQRTGPRESALGTMWNPMYFNFGIAIHGALNVPLEPASHGCIRIPMMLGEYFQSIVALGDQVFVFDGIEEPEAYDDEEKMMIFNTRDPNYTTTTTSSTLPPPLPPPPLEPAPVDEPVAAEPPPPPAPEPAPVEDGHDDDADGHNGGGDGDGGGDDSSSGDEGGGGDGQVDVAPPSATQPASAPATQATDAPDPSDPAGTLGDDAPTT